MVSKVRRNSNQNETRHKQIKSLLNGFENNKDKENVEAIKGNFCFCFFRQRNGQKREANNNERGSG
jgi:hypothetical protein